MRLHKLPEAWIAPPPVRELRELVRYRHKLVCLRTGLKAQVKAVLAKHGLHPPVNDLWGLAGTAYLNSLELDDGYRFARLLTSVPVEAVEAVKGHLRGVCRDAGRDRPDLSLGQRRITALPVLYQQRLCDGIPAHTAPPHGPRQAGEVVLRYWEEMVPSTAGARPLTAPPATRCGSKSSGR